MITLYKRFLLLFSAASMVAFVGLTGNVAIAGDAITPANEGVCDVLQTNATKGLYGLCVAYCEAQDLDVINKEPPSTKILANYDKKKQASDPDMPCVQPVGCPCWEPAEAASIYGDGLISLCQRNLYADGESIQIVDDPEAHHLATADTRPDRRSGLGRCGYKDITDPLNGTARSFKIPVEAAQSCYATLSQACADLGYAE